MKNAIILLLIVILSIGTLGINSCKQEQKPIPQDQNIQQPTPILNQVIEESKPAETTSPQEPLKVIENKTTENKQVQKPVAKTPAVSVSKQQQKESMKQVVKEFNITADEKRFDPDKITVKKGDKVKITFNFNDEDIYFGGLDIKSQYFNIAYKKSDKVKTKTVEFTAEKSFNYIGYWPATSAKKAVGHIIVE